MDASDLLGAIARLGHPVRVDGVIDQELHRVDPVRGGLVAAHVAEEARHPERIVAGGGHRADADPVGLVLILARVIDLVLYGRALACENGALHGVGRAPARGRPQQDGGQHGGGRDQPRMALVDDLAHQVALGDVRGFVGHDAGELVLVARRQDQAAVDGDEAARHGEGIDDRVAHHEVVELMLAFLGPARQAMSDLLDVVAHLRVFQHAAALAHLPEPAESGLVLILQGHGRIRRAAEIREVLLGRIQPVGPADAGARAHRKCDEEGRQGVPQRVHSSSIEALGVRLGMQSSPNVTANRPGRRLTAPRRRNPPSGTARHAPA